MVKAKQEELQKVFYSVSEKLYQAQAQAQQGMGNMGGNPGGFDDNGGNDDPNVVDADFKEV